MQLKKPKQILEIQHVQIDELPRTLYDYHCFLEKRGKLCTFFLNLDSAQLKGYEVPFGEVEIVLTLMKNTDQADDR